MRSEHPKADEPDVMRRPTELAVDITTNVMGDRRSNAGPTEEEAYDDLLLVATSFETARLPVASWSFPGGYLAWLTRAHERADGLPGHPALAHGIFVMDRPNVATHLAVTQKGRSQCMGYAGDFLNPKEKQRLSRCDPRPDEVKRHWLVR